MEIYRILSCPCDGGAASSSPRWGCSVLDATVARFGGSPEVENPCREDALLHKGVFWTVVQFHIKSSSPRSSYAVVSAL